MHTVSHRTDSNSKTIQDIFATCAQSRAMAPYDDAVVVYTDAGRASRPNRKTVYRIPRNSSPGSDGRRRTRYDDAEDLVTVQRPDGTVAVYDYNSRSSVARRYRSPSQESNTVAVDRRCPSPSRRNNQRAHSRPRVYHDEEKAAVHFRDPGYETAHRYAPREPKPDAYKGRSSHRPADYAQTSRRASTPIVNADRYHEHGHKKTHHSHDAPDSRRQIVQAPIYQPPVPVQPQMVYPPPQAYQPPQLAYPQPVAYPPPAAYPVAARPQEGGIKRLGKNLGNAAVFGVGFTAGADLVNSIF